MPFGHLIQTQNFLPVGWIFFLTSALKMVRCAFGDMDLLSAGITDTSKHTIEIHCPLFSESPTNISLFPLSFSHISVTFHLHINKDYPRQTQILEFRLHSLLNISNWMQCILRASQTQFSLQILFSIQKVCLEKLTIHSNSNPNL